MTHPAPAPLMLSTPCDVSESDRLRGLCLCPHRLHGKRVDVPVVPIPESGLVLGADCDFLAAGASQYGMLHVAPNHAVVRVHKGHWMLERGNRDMVLALNDQKIAWGDSRTLTPGDRIDMGFATLLVEAQDAATGTLIEVAAGTLIELASEPMQQPVAAAPHSVQAPLAFEPLELYEFKGVPVPQSAVPKVSGPSAAEELSALLAQDAQNSAGSDSMHYTASCSLESLLHSAPPAQAPKSDLGAPLTDASKPKTTPLFAPDDPLAALAAESAQILTGKTHLPGSCFPSAPSLAARPLAAMPARETPSPNYAEYPERDPLSDLCMGTSLPGTSLEEILEGPLTIDDVLEGLQRAHPAAHTVTDNMIDPLAALTMPERMPDPLLLLAGMETPSVREPELAPVLHRDHRSTGLSSPYHFVPRKDHTETKETTWPHPIR